MVDRTPEQLEALVLSSLTSVARLAEAIRVGLTADAFQVDVHRQAFERATDALRGGRALPSLVDLSEAGVSVTEGVQDYEGYVSELVRTAIAGGAYAVLQRQVPALSGEDPMQAVRDMVGGLSGLLGSVSVHVGATDAEALSRLERLKAQRIIVEEGGTVGVPTGLPIFDDEGRDWKPGELVTLLGYTGFGKSWLLVYFCAVAYLSGKRILFLTPEDSKHEVGLRADVVLSRLDNDKEKKETWDFTYTSLTNATVDLNQYKNWAERFSIREDWITIDSGSHGNFSVDDVLALTREHRPDVLAINGFHMLSTGRGQAWEQLFEAGRLVKGMTQDLGIVTVVVAQARRDAGVVQDSPPGPHDVAYGHAIVESSDRVISIGKVRGSPLRRSFTVPKFRNGPEVLNRQHLDFDVDKGYIRQVVKKK